MESWDHEKLRVCKEAPAAKGASGTGQRQKGLVRPRIGWGGGGKAVQIPVVKPVLDCCF